MTVFQVWNELSEQGSFGIQKRLAKASPLKIYGCVDFEGRRGIRFEGSWTTQVLPLLEFILIRLETTGPAVHLEVVLSDEALLPLFQVLAEDLVEAGLSTDASINTIVDRLSHWQTLLGDAKTAGMSMQKVRGLIGEILVLRRLSGIVGYSSAIAAWSGPLSTPQDFYSSSMCLEVKTVGPGAKRLQIQTVEQLEPSYPCALYVCLITLSQAEAGAVSAISLNALVDQFKTEPTIDPETYREFVGRLQSAGWKADSRLNTESFEVLSFRVYAVVNGFPRLYASNMPPGVSFIRYDLELAAITAFEIQKLPGEEC